MRLEDFQPAPLGAHEVLVRVRAASANPIKFVTGRGFPCSMGYDFAGVVAEVAIASPVCSGRTSAR
ncbi:alcohol dehydrogenase catalytic domain-containing protein [Dactylosporangium sp. CA-233914]|uniref:alcohol dehydrogenase catalytic domain-containing protein n=1 Tax=Dactylosporangium sp. CA-233914 TaxID=3239934 RepID=UPI003D89E0B6